MCFHLQGQSYQFKALPFGLSTALMEFTVVAKDVKLCGFTEGYKNPPVPRRLVGETHIPPNLSPAYTDLGSSLSRVRLAGEQGEVRAGTKQVFNFVGYQFDLREGKVRPIPERWQTLTDKILSILSGPVCPVRQFMSLIGLPTTTEKQVHLGRLHMRPIQWYLKNNWRLPETLEKVIPIPRSLHTHSRWWLEESNVLPGQPLHPLKHALQIFTDTSKEGRGAHLNERTARGTWSLPESKLHINHLELKAVFLALKEFQDLCCNNSTGSHRQHNSGCLYQQGRGDEVGFIVCPTVENPFLVHQETGNSQSMSHPQLAERDSRQTIQVWPGHSNGIVPSSRGVPSYMLPVVSAPSGPFYHQIQQQTTTVCLTGTRPPGMGSGCTQSVLGGSGPICLLTSSHLGQSSGEVAGLPMQQINSDCTRVAQLALVLGSCGNVQSDPMLSAQPTKFGVSTIQPDPAQEPAKSEPTCLAPRATAIKEQGFSVAVAAQIEAPQR